MSRNAASTNSRSLTRIGSSRAFRYLSSRNALLHVEDRRGAADLAPGHANDVDLGPLLAFAGERVGELRRRGRERAALRGRAGNGPPVTRDLRAADAAGNEDDRTA